MAWLAAEKTPPPLPQGGGGNHLAGGEGGCGGPCSYIYIYTLHGSMIQEYVDTSHIIDILSYYIYIYHLVCGLEHFSMFPIILGMSSSQLTFTP